MTSVVVVLGSDTNLLGDEPAFHLPVSDTDNLKAVTASEYGNHLPELWSIAASLAAQSLDAHPVDYAPLFAENNWTIITNSMDKRFTELTGKPVLEVWGSLFEAKCLRCHHVFPISMKDYYNLPEMVTCVKCGKDRVRPNIILRGERMFKRREADNLIRNASHTIFAGVDFSNPDVQKWKNLSAVTIEVSLDPTGDCDRVIPMNVDGWLSAGCPTR